MISFPMLECWNTITKVATVVAEVNKKRVLCRISLGSLSDKFGYSEEKPMRFVARHRSAIQEAARRLIENEIYEEDGSVLIHTRDL
ncbi:MAG: DUF1488 family protein [Methylococcaceae bacterium]